ncbi:MAG TPA: hypothetical protein VGP94_17190 [Tepidisphaeraceae bacterium]|nr:hypothetical protein [Tepidisphaeraceae bacterium]
MAFTEAPTDENPALFALPSRDGFSAAWLKYPPLEHQLTSSEEPVKWLSIEDVAADFGAAFRDFVKASRPSPLKIADLPLPSPLDTAVPPLPLPAESFLEVTGDVALAPGTSLNLPSWQNTEPLSNSVVRVIVDSSGVPFSHVLLQSCGMPQADKYAMQLLKTLRFQINLFKAEPTRPQSATLIFHWHTDAPIPAASTIGIGKSP